jgi:hypothetical protein
MRKKRAEDSNVPAGLLEFDGADWAGWVKARREWCRVNDYQHTADPENWRVSDLGDCIEQIRDERVARLMAEGTYARPPSSLRP